ncbi:MAG: type II toxin-antitoxin system RelE/ParE family toxin [Oscillospiraceae bacterium]|nr:type II toxin-antitoxin system RelE/ParE family toxin [Oscillospiraceae bacterium]
MEAQNKYHVVVSNQAAKMLVSHAAFLARVSPEAAERLTDAFEKTAGSLAIMPQRCPWLAAAYIPKNEYRFILFEKWYMLVFRVIDNTVYIDYTIDCRQDYGWLIR